MQKESYDIEEVKVLFLHHIFPSFRKKEYSELESYVLKLKKEDKVSHLYITLCIVQFVVIILACFYLDLGLQNLFILSVLPLAILIPVLIGKSKNKGIISKFHQMEQLEKYYSQKILLDESLIQLKNWTHTDQQLAGVDVEAVGIIEKNIRLITEGLALVTGPLFNFQKIQDSIYLTINAKKTLGDFIMSECVWLKEYIGLFGRTLATWMEVHQAELTEFQKKNLESKNEKIFSLTSTRLSSHIENIEKVRAKI